MMVKIQFFNIELQKQLYCNSRKLKQKFIVQFKFDVIERLTFWTKVIFFEKHFT